MITKSLRYDDVQVGDEIPMLEIPLTRTLIVSTAIASRDYQDVHHDPALANEKGSQDIFMNILTTNGLVGRYITDWAGPNAVLQSVKIRLGAPNYPGDTMRLTGSVIGKADGVVEVGIRGANGLGDHVTGTVALALPDPPIVWRADDGGGSVDKKAKQQAKADKKKAKQQAKKAKKKSKKSKKSKKGATT
jgi:acyl dehydratase